MFDFNVKSNCDIISNILGTDYKVIGEMDNYCTDSIIINGKGKISYISKKDNVDLYIFSATRMNKGYDEKQYWLDKYFLVNGFCNVK